MLRHNGTTTMFAWDKVQDAVNAAVNGDTIYLSNGSFSPFNVNKRIMVRGSGYDTIVQGSCNVTISGQQTLNTPVLDAITFTGDVVVTGAYKQCTIRKCQMTNLIFKENDFRDVKIERCYVTGTLHLQQCVREFNAINSSIHFLKPYDYLTGNATFNNCNIYSITDTITGTFNNCVLYYTKSAWENNSYYSGTSLISCVLDHCIYNSYTTIEIGEISSSGLPALFDTSTIRKDCQFVYFNGSDVAFFSNNSYLGSDGKPIGVYGGDGWTRNPSLPRVTNHSLAVDAVNKKLKVTLTVSK